jgi:serine/threonine protein kinase/tetratricopeptide (TPR) repeat protein
MQDFTVDRFRFNNHKAHSVLWDVFLGFNIEDQTPVFCILFNDEMLEQEQVAELQRANLILAQKYHANVLSPMAWGSHEGRHYLVLPDFGRPLSSYSNLSALKPPELLGILRSLLKALMFANANEVTCHQMIHPDNIRISLEESDVRLGFFGYPLLAIASDVAKTDEGSHLLAYFPPYELTVSGMDPVQFDLYSLGLIMLELATAKRSWDVLPAGDRYVSDELRARLAEQEHLPLPIQELFYKMLSPIAEERYAGVQKALDDVVQLVGEEESGLAFRTFVLDTLINGRFKLKDEIAKGRISSIYRAIDTRKAEMGLPEEQKSRLDDSKSAIDKEHCVIKLIDLRKNKEYAEVFHTRFRTLMNVHHEHLLNVIDVGVHFENGYIAMEAGLLSLEDLLIKRGTLPISDAGRIVYQLCKSLEALEFSRIEHHGAIKPSNVFLTSDLRTVKLGDTLVADFLLRNGNLNFIGAEYMTPELIRNMDCDVRTDIYQMGVLFFEMLVGHAPFSFKIEQEIRDDHLNVPAATRVEPALISSEVKDILLRMLEKQPLARYQTVTELREDLSRLLGYDKKEQVEVPNLFFDFAELSMIGKNAREKSEETLAIRLPAVNNRARGAVALLVGEGPELGDASGAASRALVYLRELMFHPGSVSREFAVAQKTDPEAFIRGTMEQLNQRVYRDAFARSKTRKLGINVALAVVQENTLYLQHCGDAQIMILSKGELIDPNQDKWTVTDECIVGDEDKALSDEVFDRIGFGERARLTMLKRRLQDGDQLILLSPSLKKSLSISEIKELATSSSDPAQTVDLIRGDAIRRRLEGTISVVLLSIGNVHVFADEGISHSKKGLLARNFLAQGDTYLNDGRLDEAIEQFQQALEINPNFAIIHHQLGVTYVRKGLASYALSCFERAIELNSKLASSYIEKAKIYEQQKKHREVLPLLRRAADAGARDAELFARLGHELIRARNFEQAMAYCTMALEIDPNHSGAYRDRIIALKRSKSIDIKMLKLIGGRRRLADDNKTVIEQEAPDFRIRE